MDKVPFYVGLLGYAECRILVEYPEAGHLLLVLFPRTSATLWRDEGRIMDWSSF